MNSRKILRCDLLSLLLLLTLAFAVNWSLQSRGSFCQTSTNSDAWVKRFVPERLRSFVAAYFWSKADVLMHRGPVENTLQDFQAGSYAGNTDIVPLLKLVIAIMPEETAPYQLLARNLAYYLGMREQGLRILQQGIVNNRLHPAVHELYAAAAFLQVFAGGRPSQASLRSGLKYLNGAVAHYTSSAVKFSSDPAFTLAGYHILSARFYLELDQPDKALQAWVKSGENLDEANDRLAAILRDYRDHGTRPVAGFSSVTGSVASDAETGNGGPDHEHSKDCKHEIDQMPEAPPRSPVLRLVLRAGLLMLLMLVGNYLFIRGRVSS